MDNADVQQHFRLVHKIARRCYRGVRDPAVGYNDLFSEGCIGLMKALESFDPDKGFAFSTFAYRTISGYIMMFLNRNGHIRFPGNIVVLANKILKEHPDEDDVEILAGLLQVREKLVMQALECIRVRGAYMLDMYLSETNSQAHDSNYNLHLTKVHDDLSVVEVDEFLNELPEKKRRIAELLLNGLNKKETARSIGLSSETVRQHVLDIGKRYTQFHQSKTGRSCVG